jgi:hypothetical protein
MGDFGLNREGRSLLLRRSLVERGRLGMGREKGTPVYVQWMNDLKKFGDIWSSDYEPLDAVGDEKEELKERVLRKFEGKRRKFRGQQVLAGQRGFGRKDKV